MILFQVVIAVSFLCCIALIDAASVTVTISSQNIQNGSSLTLTAVFDPATPENTLNNLQCGYSDPAGSTFTHLTYFNTFRRQIVAEPSMSAYNKARVNITSHASQVVLAISPITFDDEKRLFYCILRYFDTFGNVQPDITSEQLRLENVYSKVVLNEADSMQTSTSLTEGVAAALTCIATGRPAPVITWQYNSAINAKISNASVGSPIITVTSILNIGNSTQSMEGQQITCLVSHTFSSLLNRTTTLGVYYRPINTTLMIYPQNPILNQIITLSCNAVGNPNVTAYRFYINQTYIGNSTTGNFSVNANNCSRYNGYYRCIPVNARGEGEEKQQLVVVKDDVRTSTAPASLAFNEAENATLFCTVSGCPEPSVVWSRNGVSLNESGKMLMLPLLNRSHAGRYSCNANNAYTNSSSQIEVTVHYKPVGTKLNSNNTKPLVNTSVQFTCTSNAVPVAKYRFFRVDGSGEREVSSSNSDSTGSLMVSSIMYTSNTYNVTYKCIPYNMLGDGLQKTVMVDVQVPAKIGKFTLTPLIVNETGNVSIECSASGNPLPNITITGPNNVTVQHTMGKATLRSVNRNQAGLYTCRANNEINSPVSAAIELVVNHEPDQIHFTASPPKPISGSSVTLTCMARGSPSPSFRFILVNGSFTETVQKGSSASYIISKLDYKEYSNYTAKYQCISYNSFGYSPQQDLTLDIQVPPVLSFSITPSIVNEIQNATVNCQVFAANPTPNITIKDRNNQIIPHIGGQAKLEHITRAQAGVYSCIVDNGVGGAAASTATLNVNYIPKFLEESAVYEKCIGENASIYCNAVGNPLPDVSLYLNGILLARNMNSLSYNVAIDSTSNFGAYICNSKNSVGSATITTTIKLKPSGNVTNINLSVDKNVIRVKWDLPQCKGNIRDIKVQYRKKGESIWGMGLITATNTDKELSIIGLRMGVEYEVRVVVVDISGREHIAQASGTEKIATGTVTDTSISASAIALYTLIPLLLMVIAVLLLWIMRLRKKATSIPMTDSNASPRQNIQSHYMDLELTRINSKSQPYATITNPGALAYEKISESSSSHYTELNHNQTGNQQFSKSSNDYEVLQK